MGRGDHDQARPLLQDAVDGLVRLYGEQHPQVESFRHALAANAQKVRKGSRRMFKGDHSPVLATVVGQMQNRSKGDRVQVLHFLASSELYVCSFEPKVAPGAKKQGKKKSKKKNKARKAAKLKLAPAMLRLDVGTAMKVEGVLTAPELNGRPGVVKAWDEEKGRYVVSLQGEKRLKNIKPVHCRADVPELSA